MSKHEITRAEKGLEQGREEKEMQTRGHDAQRTLGQQD